MTNYDRAKNTEACRRWRESHREAYNASIRKRRLANRNKVNEYHRAWYAENKEKVAARKKELRLLQQQTGFNA